jgi:hypothetical protein
MNRPQKWLFIDNERFPSFVRVFEPTVIDIVRTSKSAIDYVKINGCPSFISFDHDLGVVDGHLDTAMIFVDWLIKYDLDQDGSVIPKDFMFNVHSMDPIGVDNIQTKLDNYLKFKGGK